MKTELYIDGRWVRPARGDFPVINPATEAEIHRAPAGTEADIDAAALAAGCTVVLKPSDLTPLTALELGQIAQDAGLPPGVLNIVTRLGAEAGQALADHPGVDKLAFTGSVPTGAKIMAAAARDIKKISLELGGKSPFVIFATTRKVSATDLGEKLLEAA